MKVKLRRAGGGEPAAVAIESEFIRLDAFLKFAAVASTGGEAKLLILDGLVSVNGEVCIQRGKKLRPGDSVTLDNRTFKVVAAKPAESL